MCLYLLHLLRCGSIYHRWYFTTILYGRTMASLWSFSFIFFFCAGNVRSWFIFIAFSSFCRKTASQHNMYPKILMQKNGWRVGLPFNETTCVSHAHEVCLSWGLRWDRDVRYICKHCIALQTDIQIAFVSCIWLLTPLWPCKHILHTCVVDCAGSEASFAIVVPVESKSVILIGFTSFLVSAAASVWGCGRFTPKVFTNLYGLFKQ